MFSGSLVRVSCIYAFSHLKDCYLIKKCYLESSNSFVKYLSQSKSRHVARSRGRKGTAMDARNDTTDVFGDQVRCPLTPSVSGAEINNFGSAGFPKMSSPARKYRSISRSRQLPFRESTSRKGCALGHAVRSPLRRLNARDRCTGGADARYARLSGLCS